MTADSSAEDSPLVRLSDDPEVAAVHGQLAELVELWVPDPGARIDLYQFIVTEFQATVMEASVTAYESELRRAGGTAASWPVWLLWYRPVGATEDDESLLIGTYRSRERAIEAVDRLRTQPGFSDHPEITDDDADPGFFLVEFTLDEDHWTEGFRTEPG